jgi:hypothetical protein
MGFGTKDLTSSLSVKDAFSAAVSSNTTTSGAIVDRRGFRGVTFTVHAAAFTDGSYVPVIQDGDAADLSDAAAVADTYLIGTEAGAAVDADNEVRTIGYTGKKRYVRLQLVSSGTTSGATISGLCLLSHPESGPIAQ